MKLILDNTLVEQLGKNDYALSNKLSGYIRSKLSYDWKTQFQPIDDIANGNIHNTGLVGMLSEAYSKHLKVTLNPHDIWIVLMSEVVRAVSLKPENYRHLFTTSSDKKMITVSSGSLTHMPIESLSNALADNVLFDSSIIFPDFSTSTPMVKQTVQAIFCDMAAPFYDYGMFLCGIPAIKLGGIQEDWTILKSSFEKVVSAFNTEELKEYQNNVNVILEKIIDTFRDSDKYIDFWKDIFTLKNQGSGGDLFINGWIRELFLKDRELNKITNYTSSHGIVEYSQLNTGRKFAAIYGGFNMKRDSEGFNELEYSNYVYEIIEEKDKK